MHMKHDTRMPALVFKQNALKIDATKNPGKGYPGYVMWLASGRAAQSKAYRYRTEKWGECFLYRVQ